MTEPIRLDLTRLGEVSRLSPTVVAYLSEAASVMLDLYHPAPPPPTPGVLVRSAEELPVALAWPAPTKQQRESHQNEKDAPEDGACAVAIATVHELGYTVMRRTRQGSGCDYLMVPRGEPENDFLKLEVSGTGDGNLASRLKEKVAQGKGGDLQRPGMAIVVSFKAARIVVEGWEK
ncbi:hypothetical protein WME91_27330 [Sorangium sp. So ce269]